jgi:YVTN family beta-propeller protein
VIVYRILGPIEAGVDGRVLDIGGLKQRALLAIFLLRVNEPVSRDVLIDQLWDDHPPIRAQHTLEVYISRLRKTLEPAAGCEVVVTSPGGYVLRAAEEQLDVRRFERLAEAGRRALTDSEPGRAEAALRGALALWRGAPLAEVSYEPFAQAEIARLEELRAGVVEDRIEADLALGRHRDVVSELEALAAAYPLRERLHQHLMIALYRCGRQAEALAVYQSVRRRLVEELGIEPSPALQRVERAILEHDASLELPRRGVLPHGFALGGVRRSRVVRRFSRSTALVAGGTVLAAAIALLAGGPFRGSGGTVSVAAGPDTVGVIDGGGDRLSEVITGVGRPGGVASGAGAAWITDSADDRLLRVDSAGQVVDRIPVGRGPAGVTVAGGEVWVANEFDGTVSEVNPAAGTVVATVRVGIGPDAITSGFGSVWAANVTSNTLSRIDQVSGHVVATIPLGSAPARLAAGDGGIWVTSTETGRLLLVDPSTSRISHAYSVGVSPAGVAVGADSVWVAGSGGTVTRVDPTTGRVQNFRAGSSSAGVAYADGAVWVADSLNGTVSKIDPQTGAARLIWVGNEPTDLAAAGRNVWATVLPSLTSHRGGTLTVIAPPGMPHHFLDTDPAVAWDILPWQMLSLTSDGLVGYRRVGGPAGNTLVPDLATALPAPTDSGRTYTFRLRTGIRYSTGVLVRPADIRRAIERVFMIDKQQQPDILSFYASIAGASRCERERGPCNLAGGIVADDAAGTVAFHLTAPDPDFLYKLAFSWAYAIPSGTPSHEISAAQLPATGPYMTKSLSQGHAWVLVRNPQFHQWSQQAQPGGYPDQIIVRLGLGPGQAVDDVEHGRADVLLSPPPASIGQLATHYASQLHSGPLAETMALLLNTRVAPFNRLAARQAINYAIDRNTVIALNGGQLAAQPSCQILPPTMPGYRPYCPYTIQPSPSGAWTAPNLALAKRLVRASGTRGDHVTVWYSILGAPFPSLATARYVVSVLDQIGYRASLRITSLDTYYNVLGDSRNRVQAGFFGWAQDFPAPSDFVDPLLTCGSFSPGNPNNVNDAEFCDQRIDAQVRQAQSVEVSDPGAAAAHWAAIDRELTGKAPWVSLYNPRRLIVLAAQVGNYQFHPYWNLLIDQLWVR